MEPAVLPERVDEDQLRPPKRQKIFDSNAENDLQYDRYTIAWFCMLPIEMTAAQNMLDEIHHQLPIRRDDLNTYTLGSIRSHNIVIVFPRHEPYGNSPSATVINNLIRTYPLIRYALMVGIGGAAPATKDIRLGDIVVGTEMVQYDLDKSLSGGEIHRTAILESSEDFLWTAATNLRARHEIHPTRVPAILQERMQNDGTYNHPSAPDLLFQSSYKHNSSIADCQKCDQSQLEGRDARSSCEPKIHYGTIASSNQVIRDAVTRDRIAQELGAICFEMEAAGLMIGGLPCLQIRGICDYSDSHKAKGWQKYAAAVAAAYARELLDTLPATVDTSKDSLSNARNPEQQDLFDRRQQLLYSLNFSSIDSRQAMIKPPHSKTCHWILKNPDYLAWLDSEKQSQHHGLLWLKGKPGAGKSTIMNFMLLDQNKRCKPMKAVTISFFLNMRGELLERSVLGMYRSLLLQVLQGFPDLQRILDTLISQGHVECPSLDVLKDLFRSAVLSLEGRLLTCFVDALDECDREQVRDAIEFFEDIAGRCAEDDLGFRMCFSARHYPYIDIKSGIQLTLEDQRGQKQDIKQYISRTLRIKDSRTIQGLKRIMLDRANGVFLWVVLAVNILNDENRRGRLNLQRSVQQIPYELSKLFKEILNRDSDSMEELFLSSLWILLAERPLEPEEFYHALWSGLSSRGEEYREMSPITSICSNKSVINSSKGIAEISKTKKPIVQFIHPFVCDYLIKEKGLYKL
ncbi:nucleoside phosphorylase domain-containing protein [Fusarium flagelliforme]|uniref:nucleoside phosphorylase domain-containing protein n=1 Tax=Fusarium flagelliforme TaxID=2675880 RepID=UPI001E8DFB3D|nr:nucleoside phosphorylase domain-containing protein [Fusarium flagelliforme]KAH7191792.1 nucleoside phosphorylase domain-containing protein [Fusarium flagelliforme]